METHNSAHRVYIQPSTDHRTGIAKFGNSGPLYDAIYGGELIVWSSHQPFLDACRILLADGISGPVEMWDHVSPYPRMLSTIKTAAKLRVMDSNGPPRFRAYRNSFKSLARRCKGAV